MEVANFCAAMDTLIDQDDLSHVHGTSILGINPNWLYSLPGVSTWVARAEGETANHNTNGTFDYILCNA